MKKLRVFDFDDTLAKTRSFVRISTASGKMMSLTPSQYAKYEKQPGDIADYSDFETLIEPRLIKWVFRILKDVVRNGQDAIVLTARGPEARDEIISFLSKNGVSGIDVVTLNNSDPLAKAAHISGLIDKIGYDFVEFFDDSEKNVVAVKMLNRSVHPGVKIIARHVLHFQDGSSTSVTLGESALREIIKDYLNR